jgi:hypothetical protein
MAKPMRWSFDGLGGEPWTRRTWCDDISPGRRVMIRPREWSTSTITSLAGPRVKRLCLAKVSRWGICERSALFIPAETVVTNLAEDT